MTPLEIALEYIRRGWNPVPNTYKTKVPIGNEWQTRRITEANAAQYFNGGLQNVGVQLGANSGGLTDTDLDCAEAVAIAPYVLPPTGAMFGRKSRRASHWLYVTDLASTVETAEINYNEPLKGGGHLLELRIGGNGKGAQTVFPGSTHESDEPIKWESNCDGSPATVDGDELTRLAERLAALTLIARRWPGEGRRHDAALTLGGFLARCGLNASEVAVAAEAIARAAGDNEWRDRSRAAKDAAEAYAKTGKGRGLTALKELIDDLSARRVAEWLRYSEADTNGGTGHEAPAAASASNVTTDDFVAYMPGHSYIFKPTREMWPAASVNARISPAGKTSASAWLDVNQPVEQMTWAPGEPMEIKGKLIADGGWIERTGVSVFNLYRPPAIVATPGDAKLWLDHVRKVYPDDADQIIAWLAHRVQQPREKINHALVLGGAQGIGKDTLLEPVKAAVGPWNFIEVSPRHMLGRFNGFLKSVILRVSEARDLGDIDRFAFYDHMKTYTAAPPDVLRVDEKNLREYSIPNVCGVILTTNHKADGIYLPADDRRHYVGWSELTKEDFEPGHWDTLWGWYGKGGDRHVAAYLAELDLSSFNPKAPPPKTSAFWAIVDASRAPEDAELRDLLDRMGNPNATTIDAMTRAALPFGGDPERGSLAEWIRDRKNRRVIPHRLEDAGYVPVRNNLAEDGLWKIGAKRQAVYARAALPMRDRLRSAQRLTNSG